MVIYIHGNCKIDQENKVKTFREYFKSINEDFYAPYLPDDPKFAIENLKELIASYKGDIYLIGSSLGGYYAFYLLDMDEVKKVVLIDPATKFAKKIDPNFWEKYIKVLKESKTSKNIKIIQEKDSYLKEIESFFAIGKQFKHTSTVKGIEFSNYELSQRIGDLYYDDMAEFLKGFAKKLYFDGLSDKEKGRVKLSNELFEASKAIKKAKEHIQKAWEICAIPTIKWMEKNGYNKTPTISCKKDIPKEITSRLTNFDFKDIIFLYDSTDILPLRLECNYILDKNCVFKGKDAEKFLKEYFEELGYKIFENDIKPYFQPTSHPDEDRGYLRFYYLKRYIAVKGDIVFYYDIEGILDDEEHSFLVFHYDESAKELIEGMFG